jgi:hypothetical protein
MSHLSAGVMDALTIGAAATVLALIVTLVTIRVRRTGRPGPLLVPAPNDAKT